MATLSSIPTKSCRPRNFDLTENLNHNHKTLWSLHKGFAETSTPLPIHGVAPLPFKSPSHSKHGTPLQSKHGLVKRSIGRKRQTFESIVGSCISRAVAFSDRQFKAILKGFSDLSAKKGVSVSSRDVRCHTACETDPHGLENDSGVGDGGGGSCSNEGGGGGSGSGPQGDGDIGRSGGVMGANLWRKRSKMCSTCGNSVLMRVASKAPIYEHAIASHSDSLWAVVIGTLLATIAPVLSIGMVMVPAIELVGLVSIIMASAIELVGLVSIIGVLVGLIFLLIQMMRGGPENLRKIDLPFLDRSHFFPPHVYAFLYYPFVGSLFSCSAAKLM